ncbi:MAG: IclR family transcriptional regulator domain-containing protein [Janthinobacterium lividum]
MEAGRGRLSGAALLDKACDVLDVVAASTGGLGQAELAARLGLPRTTTYRILATLVARGLLRQDPSRRVYAVGFRLLEMAQGAWSSPDLPAAAAPELRALRDATGETAYVAVLEGGEAVALGKFEGAHEVRSAARLGQRKPLHCTSQGKAILAFLPAAERDTLLGRMSFVPLTTRTLRSRAELEASLKVVRARGFAIDDEEIADGVRCVGAPILSATGAVLGALSIAGPAWRMTPERLELLGPEVAAAGRRVGAAVRPAEVSVGGVSVVAGPPAFSALGPRWMESAGLLWWVDALGPAVFTAAPAGPGTIRAPLHGPIDAFTLTRDGDCLLSPVEGGLLRLSACSADLHPVLPLGRRFTAFAADAEGRLWASALGGSGEALVGPLTARGVEPVWTLPGRVTDLAWLPSGEALYAACPSAGAIYRLQPRRSVPLLLARLPAGSGRPCGLSLDHEDHVWAALQDGWAVARFTPDGTLDRLLPLPVPRPTGLTFGGVERSTLFVATARDGVSLDVLGSAPLSGHVLSIAAETRGSLPLYADTSLSHIVG